ncbi:hypothetical protein Tco_1070235 [Tanacetum coccineum]|uniref:Uncharacterized protein n=1 Tax=Tanacetum coccineum TaxID=301880 RepID=A0ABQ5HKR4_9ASTR
MKSKVAFKTQVIMEYLVKISKKARILELKQRHLKITVLTTNTPYPSKKIRHICACTSQKTTKKTRSIRLIMTKVIKGEFEKIKSVKIDDVLLTCNTSPEIFNEEFNRMSIMEDDLFTYEVEMTEVTNISCDLKKEDDSEQQMSHESDNDMEYDPSDAIGDDEVELTDEESSDFDDEDEVVKIFRIETNVFDFETPLCRAFKEFNYLLQIDPDVLTKDIDKFKTYKEYKDDWIYKWNKDVPWVHERPWTEKRVWKEPTPVKHHFRNTLRYQDLEWYDALKDSKLKEEALKNKAIMEGMIDDNDESSNNGWRRWDGYEIADHDQEEREYENEHEDEERC